jgi:hypothetical protein
MKPNNQKVFFVTLELVVNRPPGNEYTDQDWARWDSSAAAGYVADLLSEGEDGDCAENVVAYELACGWSAKGDSEDEDDFLNKPPEPPAPAILGTSIDAVLCTGLVQAALVWQPRSYVQNSDWTEVNENRRAKNLETIQSLIQWYKDKGWYSTKQRELAEKLIKNAKALQ